MANSRSARKRIRSNEAKHARNKAVRSAVRTKVGQARRALISGGEGDTVQEMRAAMSALDRAAEKGIIHRNNASRRKSRLAVLAARLTVAAGEGQEDQARAAAAGGEKGRATRAAARGVARKRGSAGTGRAAPMSGRPPKAAPAPS